MQAQDRPSQGTAAVVKNTTLMESVKDEILPFEDASLHETEAAVNPRTNRWVMTGREDLRFPAVAPSDVDALPLDTEKITETSNDHPYPESPSFPKDVSRTVSISSITGIVIPASPNRQKKFMTMRESREMLRQIKENPR